jgi:hypothetical protein
MNIESLRKMRNADFSTITAELEKIVSPSTNRSDDDERYWKPTRDKVGNGSAEIRFLPRLEGDDLPWVRVYSHAFKGPTGKWYIENSLTTIGQDDPVGKINQDLWNTGLESDKNKARDQKRRTSFIANVYIVNDPANPDNNGTVRLFKFGKKIFDKIMDKAKPAFAEDKSVNVFDLWDGANFKLRVKNVEGFPNYDQSFFDSQSELLGGDENKLLSVIQKQHPLREFLDPKNFKSFEELSRKVNSVLYPNQQQETPTAASMTESYKAPEIKSATPSFESKMPSTPNPMSSGDEETDLMSYFNSLASDL